MMTWNSLALSRPLGTDELCICGAPQNGLLEIEMHDQIQLSLELYVMPPHVSRTICALHLSMLK